MGQVFGSEKPLKEVVRENQRMVRKAVRELDREISDLQKSEKKLIADIKKMAAENRIATVKVMAKDLVRTRNHISRFIEMKTQLNAVGLKMQTIKSHQEMAGAMTGVTKALGTMNKQMNMPKMQKIMQEFMKENEKSEVTQEMMGDTIDDAMEEETTAADEDAVVGSILAEIGINLTEAVPEAPTGGAAVGGPCGAAAPPKVAEMPVGAAPGGGGSGNGNSPPGPGAAGGGDTGMSELEARLNNLRRN